MKNSYKVLGLVIAILLLIGLLATPTGQSEAAVGFRISGRNLVDANGNTCVLRGISHAHTWYPNETSSFANIKAAGANAVRVVLSGGRWTKNSASDVANVINLCKTNKLVCVLENHDTTGYGEDGAAYSLSQAVTYWREIQSVLTGQEAYVIINIGNEPYGNNNAASWVTDTRNAITAMRSAGFDHTLMVDAPNWGQDWQFYMRDNAASIFNSDPDRNTILSIHMYGVFDTAAEIQSYLSAFASSGLPLVIGEFGHNHSDGNPDEDTIMSQAQAQNVGYIGWSWSGNSGGVEYLDMVTSFNPSQLTSWGERIINGANGLKQTAQECSIFGGPLPTAVPPTGVPPTSVPPTGVPPTGVPPTSVPPTTGPGVCTVNYAVQNQWGSGATVNVTVGNNGSSAIDGWTLTWTYPGNQQINQMWGGSYSQSGASVSVTNISWNRVIPANGGTAGFGMNLTFSGTNNPPTNFVLNGTPCNGGPQPTQVPPTSVPPTGVPPTSVPPTSVPPTTVPPTSVPPTSVPPTSVPPTTGPGTCAVSYVKQNDWGSGATVNVTVRNSGTSAVNGWTLAWTFPGNQQITNLWNGTYTQSGASVSVRNAGWNANIGANGGTVSFGFNLSYSGTNSAPTSFVLNGTVCQ